MPEREGVARVEAAVGELVHRPQVQVAELDELAHAREVEEPVAGDDARRRARAASRAATPAGRARAASHHSRPRAERSARRHAGDEPRRRRSPSSTTERERDRAVHGERHRPGDEHARRAPRRAPPRRRAARARAPRASPARARPPSPNASRRYSLTSAGLRPDGHASSVGTSPEARKRAPSRYRAPALAAEDEPAQPQRPEQQQARALGLAHAAVLGEEAQDPAQVLDARAGRRARRRRRATTSAPGKNSTFHPAARKRCSQSVSSLNMKNASSKSPTCSVAARRTSSAAPWSDSTSRTASWSKSPA